MTGEEVNKALDSESVLLHGRPSMVQVLPTSHAAPAPATVIHCHQLNTMSKAPRWRGNLLG
jgi:hypothetical protein